MSTDHLLFVVEQLRKAGSHRVRAGILLRLPDSVVLNYSGPLVEALEADQFAGGATFIRKRVAALCAVRDAHGLMPWRSALEVEAWRGAMSDLVAGKGGE